MVPSLAASGVERDTCKIGLQSTNSSSFEFSPPSPLLLPFALPVHCARKAQTSHITMAKNKQSQEKPTLSFDDMIKAGM